MSGGAWDDATMHELRVATLECAFDWFRVAERVSAVRAKTTAAAECRDRFARDFTASDASDEIESSEAQSEAGAEVVVATNGGETFQELMRHIEDQEEENLRRKERIFERVLQSLGGAGMADSVDALGVSVELNEVQLAFYEAQSLRQAEKTKRERKQLEAAEQEMLSRQRLDLQRRFDEGSADSVGIPWDPSPQQRGEEFCDIPAEYLEQLENFRIDDLLESAEFDSMLASIEEDLIATAGAKEDGDSELSEVLRFLDESATRRSNTVMPNSSPATTTIEKFKVVTSSKVSPHRDVSKETTAQVYLPGTTAPGESTSASNLLPPPSARSSDTLRTKSLNRILLEEDDDADDDDVHGDDDKGWAHGRAAIKNRAASVVSRPPSAESFPLPPPNVGLTQIPISEDDEESCVEAKSGDDNSDDLLEDDNTSPVVPATLDVTTDSIDPKDVSVFLGEAQVKHVEKPVLSSVGGSLASSRRERGNKRGIMDGAKIMKMQIAETLHAASTVVDVPAPISSTPTPPSTDLPSVVPFASPLPSTQRTAEHELIASFPQLPSVLPSSIVNLVGPVSSPSVLAQYLLAAARSACHLLSINLSDNSFSVVFDGDKSGVDPGLLHLQHTSLSPCEEGMLCSQSLPTSTCTQSFSFLLHSYMMVADKADALQQLLQSCEKFGLMLVGVRTAYVTFKSLTTQHRRILNSDMFRQIFDDGAEKMVIILALTGPKNDTLNISAPEIFRELLGPDDPALARNTDPTSVRAKYGISREQNIGVTIPVTPHNIIRDLQFWFGPEECPHSSVRPRKSLLSPSQRVHTAVFVFKDVDGLDSMRLQNSQVSVINMCHMMLRRGFAVAHTCEIIVATSQVEAVTGRTFDEKIAMALVVTFTSFAGEACLKELMSLLARGVELLVSDSKNWPFEFVCRPDFKMDLYHPADNSMSSQLSKMDPLDLGSHVSTGLPDVVTFVLRADVESSHLQTFQQREFVLYELGQSFVPGVPTCILAMGDTSSGDFAVCVRSLGAVESANEVATALNKKLQCACLSAKVKCAVTIKLLKGLSSCEMLCSNFLSRSRCFTSLAHREARDLVPGISSGVEVLFPPFEFISCGIIFIPISAGRLLSRVLKRMERLSLNIQALEVCTLNERCLSSMAGDATRVYGLNHAGVHERFQSLDSSTLYFAVLVSGNSVLSTLKNTVGPPDYQLALTAFPKSLVGSVADYAKPDLFATLTVPTAIELINHIFQTDVGQILASKPLMIGVEREQFVQPLFLHQRTRIPHDQVFQLVRGKAVIGMGSGSDAALFVVTHALINEIGLSTLFDSLARESFVVNYLKSSCLDGNTTRRVLDACGHSSLSMKPSVTSLTAGPCLFVAVDGPAGSLSRIQSLTVPNSRDIIWKLKSGEWGVAGSSSARIAREMFQFL